MPSAAATRGPKVRRTPLLARWWFWVLVALAIQFVPWPARWADAVYLRGTLPLWSAVTAPLNGASARSLSALLLLALVAGALLTMLAGRSARRAAWRALGGVVALLALAFPFAFGLGYHTSSLQSRLDTGAAGRHEVSAADREAARELVLALLQEAAREPEEGSGEMDQDLSEPEQPTSLRVQPATPSAAAARCVADYLPNVLPGPHARLSQRVKAVPQGWLLSLGFSGVVSPWLLEPHVDPALPRPSAMAVALHELAHTAGFAREDEAEAVALLAGLACEERTVRYAAALKAATWFLNGLPADERDAFLERWPAVAVEDVTTASAIARHYRSAAAAEIASRVYGTYLSSQGGEGMSDYSRAIDLVVLALTADSQR